MAQDQQPMTVATNPPNKPYRGIGWAVKELENGERVARAGWNGKGMWLELQVPDDKSKMTLPYVYMSTAQGDLVPWLCSQTDLLATDWEAAE
jgi:hypothetical protein